MRRHAALAATAVLVAGTGTTVATTRATEAGDIRPNIIRANVTPAATLTVDDTVLVRRARLAASRSELRRRLRAAQVRAAHLARLRAARAARAERDAELARARARLERARGSDGGVPAVWVALMRCEGGSYGWTADTGNGFYGGLQFTLGTWQAEGGTGMPQDASPAEQVRVGRRVLAAQGVGAWPVCGPRVGLRPGD